MYSLESEIEVTKKDLKKICIFNHFLATAGRNEEIYLLNLNAKLSITLNPKCSFINSLCMTEINNVLFLIAGCQNGHIVIYKNPFETNEHVFLQGHTGNVCNLSVEDEFLISSSWDESVRIWNLNTMIQLFYEKFDACVWSCQILKINREKDLTFDFVIGSADKTIKIYKQNKFQNKISFHLEAVRDLKFHNNHIYSIGNDGKIMKNSISGKLIKVYDVKDFLYSLSISDDKVLVTGENGMAYLLDFDLNLQWRYKLECQSCWSGILYDNKLYFVGSDGKVIVLKENPEATTQFIEEIKEKGNKNDYFLKDPNYKVKDNKVYLKQGEEWVLVGDVVDKDPDHTFEVELDGKYYTISFDDNENPYDVAEKFLTKNNLNPEFRDDIVDYMKKNFAPKSKYTIYKSIDIKKMNEYINDEFILENLKNPRRENNEEIEKRLKILLQEKNSFFVLIILRYFVSLGFKFDFCFLQHYPVNDKPTGSAFVKLIVNLFIDPPFNLSVFSNKIDKIVDAQLVDNQSVDAYKRNLEISKK